MFKSMPKTLYTGELGVSSIVEKLAQIVCFWKILYTVHVVVKSLHVLSEKQPID